MSEAESVIQENLNVVLALVDSADGKLTGEEADAVIETAVARETQTIEIERRTNGQSVEKNAADFAARRAQERFGNREVFLASGVWVVGAVT
jgi:hypothetical protein